MISFFHQSITEFLAGNYLAHQYVKNSDVLSEHLKDTRLDFVLMYAAEFLPQDKAHQYINTILDKDMILAMHMCNYLDKDAENIIQIVLEYVNCHIFDKSFDCWIDFIEADIPVTANHEAILRKIMKDKDLVGGKAAALLIEIFGESIVDEMIEEMFSNIGCYNYLSSIAEAISPYITHQLFKTIMNRVGSISNLANQDTEEEDSVSTFGILACELSFEVIVKYITECGGYSNLSNLQKMVIQEILYEDKSQTSFDWVVSNFKSGEYDLVFSLFIKIRYSNEYNLTQINKEFLNALISLLNDSNVDNRDKEWGISLLYAAYQKCPIFAKDVRNILKGSEGIVRLAVLYAIGKNRTNTFFSEFSTMLYWDGMSSNIISAFKHADWAKHNSHTDHIIEILLKKYTHKELSTFLNTTLSSARFYSPSLEIFNKLMRYVQNEYRHDQLDKFNDIGEFLSKHVQEDILFDFYRLKVPKLNQFFNYCVLNQIKDLTLSSFTKKDLNLLIAELSKVDYDNLCTDNFILSNIATEVFVKERLLTLLTGESNLLQKNLRIIVEKIESQLGRRYM